MTKGKLGRMAPGPPLAVPAVLSVWAATLKGISASTGTASSKHWNMEVLSSFFSST